MKYYLTTVSAAAAISAAEADRRGCDGVTVLWWSLVEHPDGVQAAVAITDEDSVLPGAPVITIYDDGEIIFTTDDLVEALPEDWVIESTMPVVG